VPHLFERLSAPSLRAQVLPWLAVLPYLLTPSLRAGEPIDLFLLTWD